MFAMVNLLLPNTNADYMTNANPDSSRKLQDVLREFCRSDGVQRFQQDGVSKSDFTPLHSRSASASSINKSDMRETMQIHHTFGCSCAAQTKTERPNMRPI